MMFRYGILSKSDCTIEYPGGVSVSEVSDKLRSPTVFILFI